jgi:hypothetical protein
VEIQYDRAQKLTFLKLKRMSWDRVARALSLCGSLAVFFCTGGRRRVDNHMYLCSFPSPEMLHTKEVFESDTRTCSRPRAACGANRERKYHGNSTSCINHIMSVSVLYICWAASEDREEKTHTLKHLHPCCVQLQLHLEIFFIFNLLMA